MVDVATAYDRRNLRVPHTTKGREMTEEVYFDGHYYPKEVALKKMMEFGWDIEYATNVCNARIEDSIRKSKPTATLPNDIFVRQDPVHPSELRDVNGQLISSKGNEKSNKMTPEEEYENIPSSTSLEFLTKAIYLQQKRAKTYDVGGTMAGERSMGRTVQAFNTITGHTLRESDGWLLLQLLKDVRDQTNGPHMDSLEDCVSYAALKAEARAAGK